MPAVVMETSLAGIPLRRGKVRDIYDLGDSLLLVSTDRISAFDWVLPTGIPDKGRVLTSLSAFWFDYLKEPNHLISTDVDALDLPQGADRQSLAGRSMLVRKTEVVPIECVVRGYLAGSGWKEYQSQGTVCGIQLPQGLKQSDRLPEPIFTPATKADSGHDENISFENMVDRVGLELSEELRRRSLEIYRRGAEYALQRDIIIADTKFEFGQIDDELILIDEVLTSDSSRFWPSSAYQVGVSPPSFDKQFVRDWLETTDWDKNSPPPPLPDDVAAQTRDKYIEAYETLAGQPFPMTQKWETYEEVAAHLLNRFADEFGLSSVEGKQKVSGDRSGTKWEIDAKGIKDDRGGFMIVECRRNLKVKQSQEKLAGLAYRIFDTGASGGIYVSPRGFQKGAKKVAAAEDIFEVTLSADSTSTEFVMGFLNKFAVALSNTLFIRGHVDAKSTRE